VAWGPVGRGTGPSSGAQDAKAGAGRSAGPRPRPSMGKPDPPWGRLAPRFSARSSPAHWAQSLAQLPGEAGGLGHTSENGPGATVRGATEVSIGYPADGVVRPVLKNLPSLNLGR
jgi:hypothetical protein